MQGLNRLVVSMLILIVLFFGILQLNRYLDGPRHMDSAPRAVELRGKLADFEQTTISIFNEAAPSVVYIFTENAVSGFFGIREIRQGAGSGFLWDEHGHIVTNNHVIQGAQRIQVRLDNGEAIEATHVGGTPDYDLAVIRLRSKPSDIRPIPVGTSSNLQVGQTVLAIGNPFGLTRTLTTGVISALNRRLPLTRRSEVEGVIQTDAAINPGNSGGPLLDSAGRLIGVNTLIISESGSSAGIGFAVPVDIVNEVVPQLIAKGKVSRPGIGVYPLDDDTAAGLGVLGVVIESVEPGSEAEQSGLRGIDYRRRLLGDIIVAVDGKSVSQVDEFVRALQLHSIGGTVTLSVERRGQVFEIPVVLMDIS